MTDTTKNEEQYPECNRMNQVRGEAQSIGCFLEWLGEQGLAIADSEASEEHNFPIYTRLSIEELLAKYFEIDLDLVEKERRAMIANLK